MIAEICRKEDCVGCALCENICPKNAISIEIREGFYRPVISKDCISCGACMKNCPANNRERIQKCTKPDVAFAAWCKDDMIHYESSSGGLAYKIASAFIQSGGAVAGIWFNPVRGVVEHRLYEYVEDLSLMRGSRYVQSNKTGIYRAVAEKLKEKAVLFIGVPCEVYAMEQYWGGRQCRHKLFCIDILCHGGASPQCMNEHISAVSLGRKIGDVTFRGGKYDCRLTVWGGNGKKLYSVGQFTDPYFLMFMKRAIYQNACYNCAFAGVERVGDLTLGDFWGIDSEIETQTHIRGINMLFVNSQAGQGLISRIESDIVVVSRPIEEAVSGNDTLRKPTKKPTEYDELWKDISQHGFHKAIKEVYGISWARTLLVCHAKMAKAKVAKILRSN